MIHRLKINDDENCVFESCKNAQFICISNETNLHLAFSQLIQIYSFFIQFDD